MASSYRVPYSPRGTDYSDREITALNEVLGSAETLSCGRERAMFEREFAEFIGVAPKLAVATTNCTVSLELATYIADLKPGGNVIVTPQSYQATLNPLLALDVEVRFGDIDPETLCLNPLSVKALIDKRTRAVILTHYGGLMVDMDLLSEVLDPFDVIVIEDCAHAHGSSYKGRMAGAFGNISCYSFQSMKNMSTLGQGGMLLLPDEEIAARVRALIAVEPDATFVARSEPAVLGPYGPGPNTLETHEKQAFTLDCTAIARHGTNATLSEPAAAVGRIQLVRLPEFIAKRKRLAAKLDKLLDNIPGITPQRYATAFGHSHHLYTCFCEPGIDNMGVAADMVARGVEIQQRYFPLHLLPEWRARGGKVGDCPVTEHTWFRRQLNLPIYPFMTNDQVEYMAASLAEVMRRR